MKKLLFIVTSIFIISCDSNDNVESYPEKIFEGDITLKSQIEVNDFGNEHYTKIVGSLRIIGNSNFEYINDLSPLESISVISEDLQIKDNPELISINLSNVRTVGGALQVTNNDSLINLDGLSELSTLGSYIRINDNYALLDIDGLSSITSTSSVYVSLNNSLQNLNGLQNITTINRDIEIFNNSALENIEGLSNAIAVHLEKLRVDGNQSLISLNGLNGVYVTDHLYVASNPLLLNFQGLENLTSIGLTSQGTTIPHLIIYYSDALTSLEGLENIEYVGGTVEIKNNPQLIDFCALQPLVANDDIYGYYIVMNNLYNPSEQNMIEGNCSQ